MVHELVNRVGLPSSPSFGGAFHAVSPGRATDGRQSRMLPQYAPVSTAVNPSDDQPRSPDTICMKCLRLRQIPPESNRASFSVPEVGPAAAFLSRPARGKIVRSGLTLTPK